MNVEFKDQFGQQLEVGDKVLYCYVYGRGATVCQAEVLSFTKEMVRIDMGNREYDKIPDAAASYGYRMQKSDRVKPTIVAAGSLTKVIDKNGDFVYTHQHNGCRGRF